MTAADMDAVVDAYVAATERAERAGFDMIELHAAHGYLLAAFLSPLLNRRVDQFGDSQFGRRRFPLRVFEAVRAAWPADKPISVRISATDWVEGGLTPTDAVRVAAQFVAAGADIIDVSAGQTTPDEKPVYGRMYQTPLSDQIRNEAKVPTMAVGNIYLPDHVNSIIAAGRADLCCLGRPHLADPNWTLRAAMAQGASVQWPAPYVAGGEQLARLWARGEDLALVAQTYLGTKHE
jgi:anthraniloyl-CoA monooxygenase